MDDLSLLIYAYLFTSQEGKSMLATIQVSRRLLAWVSACDCSFSEEQMMYELEFNLDAIRLILQPLLCGGMTCLSIFDGGVLTNLCLVSSWAFLT